MLTHAEIIVGTPDHDVAAALRAGAGDGVASGSAVDFGNVPTLTNGGGALTAFALRQDASIGDAPATDDLYDLGKTLFDQFAPPEIKEQYEFPSKAQWDAFATQLQRALENDDLQQLGIFAPQVREALTGLRAFPGAEDYADWLAERLDYAEAAEQTTQPAPPAAPAPDPARRDRGPWHATSRPKRRS